MHNSALKRNKLVYTNKNKSFQNCNFNKFDKEYKKIDLDFINIIHP